MLALSRQLRRAPAKSSVKKDKEECLKGGSFRLINEIFYTKSSREVKEILKSEKRFNIAAKYHEGYEEQMKKWPMHPLDRIIPFLEETLPKKCFRVADLGCGNCRLEKELQPKGRPVISVDFAPPPKCDLPPERDSAEEYLKKGGFIRGSISSIPILPDSCVTACVFSLSLMGTDWPSFLGEAWRILEHRGILIIAEVTSRLKDPEKFVQSLKRQHLQHIKTDPQSYFTIFYFRVNKKPKEKEPATDESNRKQRRSDKADMPEPQVLTFEELVGADPVQLPQTNQKRSPGRQRQGQKENAKRARDEYSFDPSRLPRDLLEPCWYQKK